MAASLHNLIDTREYIAWRLSDEFAWKRTVSAREEFRVPAGVRKSPRKEPADHGRWLWEFLSRGYHTVSNSPWNSRSA